MKLGISDFARNRHKPGSGYSHFTGSDADLLALVEQYWEQRTPGAGRTDLEKVVLVPIHPRHSQRFIGNTVSLHEDLILKASIERRQPHEDPYVKVLAKGVSTPLGIGAVQPNSVKFVNIVLYSADALLENDGTRSGDFDWEVVALIASDVENEPMYPLAMARNFLQKPGGTFAPYTAQQFAEAIYYWASRVSVDSR